jgi:hypothetical protein
VAIRSHYDVLGVARTASQRDIKTAFREKARRVHPDRVPKDREKWALEEMATLNVAWSVLSDPVKRREYDESLARDVRSASSGTASSDTVSSRSHSHSRDEDAFERDRLSQIFAQRPLNSSPARFPWRTMSVVAVLAIVVVVIISILAEPPGEAPPDQLLQSGSCVVIEPGQSVREVSCRDDHDGVVRQLVGFDVRCPSDSQPYRDRQGMGTACVILVGGTTAER